MRRQLSILFAVIPLLYNCNNHLPAKTRSKAEAIYLSETKKFIGYIRSQLNTGDSILLVDKPPMHEFNDCLEYLFSDSSFTKPEQVAVKKQISAPFLSSWNTTIVQNAGIISRDTVKAILNDKNKGWNYFHKQIAGSFHSFSAPIFLRNYTLCLFYSDHACGNLCGSGQITLFKKERGEWKPLRSLCDWVS